VPYGAIRIEQREHHTGSVTGFAAVLAFVVFNVPPKNKDKDEV
jgi:hypothetical protein